MPKHLCALCGQISFKYYHEYEKHRAEAHGMKTAIKPENVTGRSRAQIVKDAEESYLQPFLIETELPAPTEEMPAIMANNKEHLAACRCNACFNKQLDSLIASQEMSLKHLNEEDNRHAC